jgi:alkanesulfonate monooxygenase SsuD/methylene tetrahydromethanopterin reductase-like flavin-dependent oxidoreductase (luciferase family)
MGIKFGIFDHIERRRDVPLDQQYRDRLEWVGQAEQAGFHCYHVAEHHHSPLCLAPNQAVYLADTDEEAEASRSLALFATEVMPHFVAAPVSASIV